VTDLLAVSLGLVIGIALLVALSAWSGVPPAWGLVMFLAAGIFGLMLLVSVLSRRPRA
jgi:hypothetical protein